MPLSLRLVNQRSAGRKLRLLDRILGSLLKSLSYDGLGFAGIKGSIELRPSGAIPAAST